VQIEQDERQRLGPPTERRTRERGQEIRDRRRYLKQDRRFRNITRTVRRLHEGPERREALRRFWEEVYDDDPLVQAREDQMSVRGHILAGYIELEDEERRDTGREYKVIHPHSPDVRKVFPLRRPRSAEIALLQE
jgi:hypothetical protein